MSVRVLVTDDHGVLREGVISILDDYAEFVVVAEARDGEQALELARRVQPDVIILDLMLPILDGLQVARRLRRTQPDVKIVVLSALAEPAVVDQAKAIGVDAYVSKTRCVEDLVDALRLVAQGEKFVSPGLSRYTPVVKPSGTDRNRQLDLLTLRERQVMSMIASGLTNKQIAHRLGISVHTVRSHRQRLMDKLDVHDIATLTRIAVNWGVLGQ
ncbi:MAG TPA: response regulator transcription factor [Thermoflexia bacterium]|nr:response regulator transcription factor [Thermoflexia bacterium]